jgi:hypothetical protein
MENREDSRDQGGKVSSQMLINFKELDFLCAKNQYFLERKILDKRKPGAYGAFFVVKSSGLSYSGLESL